MLTILSSPVWPLPIYLDSQTQHSYAILLPTASDFTSITSHIHNWALFLLWLHLFILSELFLHFSPAAYWAPTHLGSSSFSVIFFAFSYCSWGSQGKNTEVASPSPVGHVLPDLSTRTRLSSVALHSMAHSFIELDKAVVHVISSISFLWLWFSFCLPSDGEG